MAQENKITAKQFLNKDSVVTGYSTPGEYLTYLQSLRNEEVDDLTKFFDAVKEGLRLSNVTRTRKDRGGRVYLFPIPVQPKSGSGLKIILEAGMTRFIEDYINGKITIEFGLEELAEEALNP